MAPVSRWVLESWLGVPADMLRPGYLAGNGTGPQPPDRNCYESPVSLCFLGTYFPCICTNTGECVHTKVKTDTNTLSDSLPSVCLSPVSGLATE